MRAAPYVVDEHAGEALRVQVAGVLRRTSTVELETAAGPLRGKLIGLPGRPGWGVWYAVADTGVDRLGRVTVHDTEGRVHTPFP
ncbi:hypothetical protein ACF08A_01275 [Streptomyces cellulosae]